MTATEFNTTIDRDDVLTVALWALAEAREVHAAVPTEDSFDDAFDQACAQASPDATAGIPQAVADALVPLVPTPVRAAASAAVDAPLWNYELTDGSPIHVHTCTLELAAALRRTLGDRGTAKIIENIRAELARGTS